jgi:probable HAF family extracellular repeat protein
VKPPVGAFAINGQGQVVGQSGSRAFLYSGGVLTDLNTLLPTNSGWTLTYAFGINGAGQIVGWGTHNGQAEQPFLLSPPAPLPVSYPCTEAGLDSAIAAGGAATFACASPTTIAIGGTKTVSTNVSLDGGGLLTISGGNQHQVFVVNDGVWLGLANLTVSDGLTAGAGGAIFTDGGSVALSHTTFSRNAASNTSTNDGYGGAIAIKDGTLTVSDSTFDQNTVTAGHAGYGGAIFIVYGALQLVDNTFTKNTVHGGDAADGGALFVQSLTATIAASTFSGNAATASGSESFGGAIANETDGLGVTSSTFVSNLVSGGNFSNGGAIATNTALAVSNSTFVANNAGNAGGAIDNASGLTITSSTFSGNMAAHTGNTLNNRQNNNVPTMTTSATLTNTIVAASQQSSNCAGSAPFTDGGHNVDTGTSCGFNAAHGSLSNTNPWLDPRGLADNGGPTQTILLAAGSPAIDAGDNNQCPATDQRGVTRPQGARCDIGAVEVVSNSAPMLTSLSPATAVAGSSDTLLTMTGSNFVSGFSTITFGSISLPTTFVSATQLMATIPAGLLTSVGMVPITVMTGPPGGGTSPALTFTITAHTGTTQPALTVQTAGTGGGTVTPVVGTHAYSSGSTASLTATAASGTTFTGWTVDGTFAGFGLTLTLPMTTNHTVTATFATTPTFPDVSSAHPYFAAISALAARDIIHGYANGLFGPSDLVVRAQAAALATRPFGWQTQSAANPFPDRCAATNPADCVDDELWHDIGVLNSKDVARGYPSAAACAPWGTPAPCYLPRVDVLHIQVVSLITRAMEAAGYWQAVSVDDPALFTNVPASTGARLDLATYAHYVQPYTDANGLPLLPTLRGTATFPGYDQPATRGYTAQVIWQAYAAYWSTNHLP